MLQIAMKYAIAVCSQNLYIVSYGIWESHTHSESHLRNRDKTISQEYYNN